LLLFSATTAALLPHLLENRRNKMPDNELSNPWEPKNVRNQDVVGSVERADRYAFDLIKFESAMLNDITSFDMDRIISYVNALRTYVNTLNDAPATDNPHSYPGMYTIYYLTEGVNFDDVKNKALRDIIRMLVNTWVNMSRSESADRSNGFLPFDVTRWNLHLDRIEYYIKSYIDESLPLDLPESSAFEDANNNK
jgi:hypothetical protein